MMRTTILAATLIAGVSTLSLTAHAQNGVAAGATTGAVSGGVIGGPVGAVVGGVSGAIIGGIADDQRPRFREYVVQERVPSYVVQERVIVGSTLPEAGVTYYDVPQQYGATNYRYTVVNDRTVLIDPRTRRVIQVID